MFYAVAIHIVSQSKALLDGALVRDSEGESEERMTTDSPRAKTGEQLDIAQLYQRHGRMVLRRIRSFFRGEEAEEVLQEVFLQVVEKQDTFRAEASATTWLYRLTTNYCLNRIRNQSRRRELWEEQGMYLWSSSSQRAGQETRMQWKEVWRQLPEELVQIAVYYYLDGMTHAEIGRVLGISRRTVGNRMDELSALIASATTAGAV